ncbi:hypothetical protein GC209_10730 [bacterium]|nr:hypothetical protein [bacterium]
MEQGIAVKSIVELWGELKSTSGTAKSTVIDRYMSLICLHLDEKNLTNLWTGLGWSHIPGMASQRLSLPPAFSNHVETLGPIAESGHPGISIVTCCMNRNDNLKKAIPSWLANPEISEIIIVDWSSDHPVADDFVSSGIADP